MYPVSSISPVFKRGWPLASNVLKIVSIPEACSKITSAVSGLVRQSFTAKMPPCAEIDAGAVSCVHQRIASRKCAPQLAICDE